MKARDMFLQENFILKTDNKHYLTYERTSVKDGKNVTEVITFDKYEKRVGGSEKAFPKKYWFSCNIIEAIYKQLEELNYIENTRLQNAIDSYNEEYNLRHQLELESSIKDDEIERLRTQLDRSF
jgi:hypothetical protein